MSEVVSKSDSENENLLQAVFPTFSEFMAALSSNSHPVPSDVAVIYKSFLDGGEYVQDKIPSSFIQTKREMAMFLAQCLYESRGLRYKEEIGIPNTGIVQYHGRGYIKLTQDCNYKECSQDLYGDNRLERNPDLVSVSEDEAWRTSFWFWCKKIHPGLNERLDITDQATNPFDCPQGGANLSFIFSQVLQAFNLE